MRTFLIFLSFFIFGMSLAAMQPGRPGQFKYPTGEMTNINLMERMQPDVAAGSSPGNTPTTTSENPSGQQVPAAEQTFHSLPLPDLNAFSHKLLIRKPSSEKPLITPPPPHRDNSLSEADVSFLQGEYRCIEKLGNGSQGTVFKAIKANGQTVALKVTQAPRWDYKTNRDAELNKILDCDAVIKYYYSFKINDKFTKKTFNVIEMPLYKQNLSQYADSFNKQGMRFHEDEIWVLVKRMALALIALEEKHIVHLDIKPDNIFLNDDCSSAVLGDFDLLQINGASNNLENEGDARFAALEFTRASEVTHTFDVASLGWVLYSLISTIKLPNGGEDWEKLRENRAYAEAYIDKGYSYGLTELIFSLVGPAEQRPNAVAILNKIKTLGQQ